MKKGEANRGHYLCLWFDCDHHPEIARALAKQTDHPDTPHIKLLIGAAEPGYTVEAEAYEDNSPLSLRSPMQDAALQDQDVPEGAGGCCRFCTTIQTAQPWPAEEDAETD